MCKEMAKNQTNESDAILDSIVTSPYKYGYTTNLETEDFEKGLNRTIVEKISIKKEEPEFLKKFRQISLGINYIPKLKRAIFIDTREFLGRYKI